MSNIKETLRTDRFELGELYTRETIPVIGSVTPPKIPRDWTGIVEFENCFIFFVTLDKATHAANAPYNDYFFDEGKSFRWDSQSRNSQSTRKIKRIIEGAPALLFVRVKDKVKGKTQPFVYAGPLKARKFWGEKPVSFEFDVAMVSTSKERLSDLYNWGDEGGIEVKDDSSEAAKIDKSFSGVRSESSPGQGYLQDQDKKKAIEHRAMKVARDHYESKGYLVTDTSDSSPYDFFCERGDDKRRVEVKGTTGSYEVVSLTKNEVDSARLHLTDLYILYSIETNNSSGHWVASGGKTHHVVNWVPDDEDLTPTQFRYSVPITH